MNDSSIAPAMALWIVLAWPAFLFSLARWAWRGLTGLTVLTHLGFRSGGLARIYAVIYLLTVAGLLAMAPRLWQSLATFPPNSLTASLLYPYRMYPVVSLLLMIGGSATLAITPTLIRRGVAKGSLRFGSPRRRAWFYAYLYAMPTIIAGVGLLSALPLPFLVLLAFVLAGLYFTVAAEVVGVPPERNHGPA